jgi:hypothetical protein
MRMHELYNLRMKADSPHSLLLGVRGHTIQVPRAITQMDISTKAESASNKF